ncbi:hypothetical protein AWN76_004210 [Rhodothermaceae bacterium RA]|nr:hypothetical protein AWN76_004210 [Rhodothermaceae bacterium RA]
MSEHTLSLLAAIRDRLRATIRRITLAELACGLLLTLGILAGVLCAAVAVEAGFWLDPTPRTVLYYAVLGLAGGLLVYFGVIPLLRLLGVLPGPGEQAVARRIGQRYPEVADRLVNLLDLAEGRRSEAPPELVDRAVRMLGEQVQSVPFEQVEDFQRVRRVGRLASLPVVGLLVFMLVTPGRFFDAAGRLFSPGTAFERPAPFRLLVEPGSVELVKGEALEITARADGSDVPPEIELALNQVGEDLIEPIRLTADSTGTFRHTVVNVRASFRYRLDAGAVTTPWYEARVVERPLVRSLRVALTFPAYTRIPPQRLAPNAGDVTALPGTEVAVEVELGGPDVTEAFLRFDDGRLDTLTLDGTTASGRFTLRRAGSYQILLRNAEGLENRDPITYTLTLLTDAYPSVVLLSPAPQTELSDALRADLRLRIHDDFGFSRLRLYYRLAESRFGTPQDTFSEVPLPLEDRTLLDQEMLHIWLLNESTGLDLVPGDVVEYYVKVWDNDAVAGYKAAQSATHRLRLPSLAEQYRELDAAQDEAQQTMEELLQETDQLRDQFQELRDELRRKQQSDWEDERQLEQVQQRQQQIEQRVEELSREMQRLSEQMEENDLVSPETLELYRELQKTVEEINSPELQEALQRLQEAMQNLDLPQMQQSLQDFEFNEEQYQQRLERALELFKRIRLQQNLEEAARRAEELARRQERLAEQTRQLREEQPQGEQNQGEQNQDEQNQGEQNQGEQNQGEQNQGEQNQGEQNQGEQHQGEQNQDAERLAREQERSREEMEELAEQLRDLLEQMEQMRNTPADEMEQLHEDARRLPRQMEQNAEQLRQNRLDQAQQGQQQMQQQLQQMQQRLQQMQQGMQGQMIQVNRAGLRRALDDILRLSQQQESLRGDVSRLASDSPRLRTYAQRQVELSEGLTVVSDSLQRLAREIPQMSRQVQQQAGEALREMTSATEALAERTAVRAAGHQKGSMMHLNELALLLSELLDQLMNMQQSGGSGSMSLQQMIQQLQQMAGQQQQLNQQLQQLLNDMQGDRLTSDMQQRLQQMAAQQEALRRQLREMSRNPEARGKLLGDLNKIAEQMEETIQELQRNRASRQTVQRQQQILTRLLDAQRSIRERGRENRREGQRPEQDLFDRDSPPAQTPAEQADQLRRALIRALESGYAPDYEELIKRYFELLQSTDQ